MRILSVGYNSDNVQNRNIKFQGSAQGPKQGITAGGMRLIMSTKDIKGGLILSRDIPYTPELRETKEILNSLKNVKLIAMGYGLDSYISTTSKPTMLLYMSDNDLRNNTAEGKKTLQRGGFANYQLSVLGSDKKITVTIPERDLTENLINFSDGGDNKISPALIDIAKYLDEDPTELIRIEQEVGDDINLSEVISHKDIIYTILQAEQPRSI